MTIIEKLNELDTKSFNNDEHIYDLVQLYSGQSLSDERKTRLTEALQKEDINQKDIYDILVEGIEEVKDENEDTLDEAVSAYDLEKELADPEFVGKSYYGPSYRGLEDDITTTDYEELKSWIWEKLNEGNFVEADGLDGLRHRYSPDKLDWEEDVTDIEDCLVESIVTEQHENSNFTRADVRNIAEKFINLAEEYELYPELWEYSVTEDGKGKIVLFIDGDWKHDHLALDWLFQDFYMKENFKCISSVTNETDSDGSDSYGGTHTYIIKNEPFMTVETISESVDEPQDADDIRSYINNKKKFTNGTVAEFDPQSLMNKVAETGYSLNSIREDSEGNEYYISIHYEEWYGPKGVDNPDEMYYVDVVKETPDGNQTRLFTKDGTATEIVNILNDWKASVK